MKERRYIVDTTLRDGEQSPGIAFSVSEKVKLAGILESTGVYQIEAGIPALGGSECEAIAEIVRCRNTALISAWNRLSLDDISKSFACRPDIIHISLPVSYVQLYVKLRKNKKWLLRTAVECVNYAREHGFRVTVGYEDASRADIGFLITLSEQLAAFGVEQIRYADTVGVLFPSRARDNIRTLLSHSAIPIEFHAHNDLGMAVANSILAMKGGARYCDCTLLGIGERAGNCCLSSLLQAADSTYDFGISRRKANVAEEQLRSLLAENIE